MNNIEILASALDYIEKNLGCDMKTQDVATACYCSKSALEKMFRYVNHIGVHDYIIRRRMMLAAREIIGNPDKKLLDVALNYGYNTNESFTRAFKSVWNVTPSEFRNNSRFSELFPRLYPPIQDGGTYMSKRKNVDISELYELFTKRKDCYFVCCDIKELILINEIGFKAGDLAILEAMKRMEKEAGEDDIVFRIGGDEFVLLTSSEDITYAENVSERIRSYNNQAILYEDKEIPVSLYTAIVKLEQANIRYAELFKKLHTAIMENK